MPKLKKPATKPNSLKDFLETYDTVTLRSALLSFEDSTGWGVLRAYLAYAQRGYEVDALDKIVKPSETAAAAYASGYAKCAEDIANTFLPELHEKLLGASKVFETPRPEE